MIKAAAREEGDRDRDPADRGQRHRAAEDGERHQPAPGAAEPQPPLGERQAAELAQPLGQEIAAAPAARRRRRGRGRCRAAASRCARRARETASRLTPWRSWSAIRPAAAPARIELAPITASITPTSLSRVSAAASRCWPARSMPVTAMARSSASGSPLRMRMSPAAMIASGRVTVSRFSPRMDAGHLDLALGQVAKLGERPALGGGLGRDARPRSHNR